MSSVLWRRPWLMRSRRSWSRLVCGADLAVRSVWGRSRLGGRCGRSSGQERLDQVMSTDWLKNTSAVAVRSHSATGPPRERNEAYAFRRIGRRRRGRDVEGHGVEDAGAQVDPTVLSSRSAVLVAGIPLEVVATAAQPACYPPGTRWAGPGRCPLAPNRPDPNRQTPTRPLLIRRFLFQRVCGVHVVSFAHRGLPGPTA